MVCLQACRRSADKVKQRIKTIPLGFDKTLGARERERET